MQYQLLFLVALLGVTPRATIRLAHKVGKQRNQRCDVDNVNLQSKSLAWRVGATRIKQVCQSKRNTHYKLDNLHWRQILLARRMKTNSGCCIIKVHDSVDEGIECAKHPNCCTTIADTSPHGDQSASMVEELQEWWLASLEHNDNSIHHFIVFGKIK